MAAIKQPTIITIEDYEACPEDERTEVYEGVPYAMAAPSTVHQSLLIELCYLIKDYIKKNNGKCKVFPAPFDVKLADDLLTIVQPDISIICDTDKLDKKRCNGAPDFIIEIVSPGNSSLDYVKKTYYYQEYGVREYWIVDPQKEYVTVFHFDDDSSPERYTFDDKIKVGIYKDLYIDFAPLKELL